MRVALSCLTFLAWLQSACEKAPQQQKPTDEFNRVVRNATPAPNNFVHGTFKLPGYAKFEFEVPAHTLSPKILGTFKSYVSGDPNQAAKVDLLLMTPKEFNDFRHGVSSEVGYSVPGSSGGTVDYALPATMDQPQKYYLVFRNLSKGKSKSVEADFTATF